PRIVGQGIALDLILTGREVDADEAMRIGLANRLVAAGTAREHAVDLGRRLATFPRTTMLCDLAAAREAFDRPLGSALLAEHEHGMEAIGAGGPDAGVAAFRSGAGRGHAGIDLGVPDADPSGGP
ncbi:MAG: enoyl-CoA hydratase-related protein, partial [Actinomycetota bacterium]